ncbi:hypothetical protein QE400_003728 [Xanthomonas sacchari]|nr:hypothetical protein [Xanthomonas sacchari]
MRQSGSCARIQPTPGLSTGSTTERCQSGSRVSGVKLIRSASTAANRPPRAAPRPKPSARSVPDSAVERTAVRITMPTMATTAITVTKVSA